MSERENKWKAVWYYSRWNFFILVEALSVWSVYCENKSFINPDLVWLKNRKRERDGQSERTYVRGIEFCQRAEWIEILVWLDGFCLEEKEWVKEFITTPGQYYVWRFLPDNSASPIKMTSCMSSIIFLKFHCYGYLCVSERGLKYIATYNHTESAWKPEIFYSKHVSFNKLQADVQTEISK